MLELKYKTRGDSSPRDKSRVFFAFHPADYDLYFNEITELILKYQNCAIYYYPVEVLSRPVDRDDIEEQISEMQLIVIPITTNLLIKENIALSLICPLALEKHIPILPIMMEDSLEDVYKRHFGDLQYITIRKRDITEIPFEEKLEKYLSGVLVGDELAARVRDAFKAYIFLSYRKKDRKQANELMRLIHSNERFNDIAIWYDEYLVIGESFTDNIKKALEKSRLFALVVTPSLLEDGNYVMREEYPYARNNNKDILPFEMSETDRDRLRELFADIPECISKDDEKKREEILLDYLSEVAHEPTDDDPVHNYLIGLAYLEGIDVERDNEKAVELITRAADMDLIEAVDKLANMYRFGHGVEPDYTKYLEWVEKAIKILQEKYDKNNDSSIYTELINTMTALGRAYRKVDVFNKAIIIYKELLKIAELNDDVHSMHIIYDNLGLIESCLGDNLNAKEYFEKSLEMMMKDNHLDSRELSVHFERMGDIQKELGDCLMAKRNYEKSLAFIQIVREITDNIEVRHHLSISYRKMGDIEEVLGNLSKAKEFYEKSLKVEEGIEKETDGIEFRMGICKSYVAMGDIESASGDYLRAKEYYEQSLRILEEIKEKSDRKDVICSLDILKELTISYERMGDIIESSIGDHLKAREYYVNSLDIKEKIWQETDTLNNKVSLSISYERMGDIEKVIGDYSKAKEYYEKSLRLRERIIEENDSIGYCRYLYISYAKIGEIEINIGDSSAAKKYYKKAVEIIKNRADETVRMQSDLSNIYNGMGSVEQAMGNWTDARLYYKKSVEIDEQLLEKTDNVGIIRNLFVGYRNQGMAEMVLGDFLSAEVLFEKANEKIKSVCNQTRSSPDYNSLINSYEDLVFIETKLDNHSKVSEYSRLLQKAKADFEKLYKAVGNSDCLDRNLNSEDFINSVVDIGSMGVGDEFLKRVGFDSVSNFNREEFVSDMQSEFEIMVGEKMSDLLTDDQVVEFEEIIDGNNKVIQKYLNIIGNYRETEAYKMFYKVYGVENATMINDFVTSVWLGIHCPQYNNIIKSAFDELEKKIKFNKDELIKKYAE